MLLLENYIKGEISFQVYLMLSYIRKTLYKCKHIQCLIYIFRTPCSSEIEETIMRILFCCQRLRHQLMAFPIALLKEKSAPVHQCVKIELEDWGSSSLVGHVPQKLKLPCSSPKLEMGRGNVKGKFEVMVIPTSVV